MRDALAITLALEEIYARIPKIKCQRKCQDNCGPIVMATVEWDRLKRAGPVAGLGGSRGAWQCPLLIEDSCSRYALRPIICRLFGVTRELPCPFGCVPERWLSERESRSLIAAVERLSDGNIAGPGLELVKIEYQAEAPAAQIDVLLPPPRRPKRPKVPGIPRGPGAP